MIRVLIVDDEYLIRKLIRNSVDWDSLGLEIAGEAEDGEKALELVAELKPDLIILDINIPFIDGIELSKVIREFYPDIYIIILTGYGEFKYAKEAINAGVISYLLKPIDTEEFIRALMTVKKDIIQREQKSGLIKNAEYKSFLNDKEEFLNTVIKNSSCYTGTILDDKMRHFKVELSQQDLCVVTVSIDGLMEKYQQESEIKLRRMIVSNVVSEIISEKYPTTVFMGPDSFVIVITNLKAVNNKAERECFKDIWKRSSEFIKSNFDITITMGVSEKHNGFAELPVAYNESIRALEKKFIYGNGQVIFYVDVRNQTGSNDFKVFYDKNELAVGLRVDGYDHVKQTVEKIYKRLIDERADKEYVLFVSMDLLSIISNYIFENGLQENVIFGNKTELVEELRKSEVIYDIQYKMLALLQESIHYVCANRKANTIKVVDKAKSYIQANYANGEISLEEIAHKIYVNPSYLSKVFKKELGYSVVEYLTDLRLKKAKEILDCNSSAQLYDIAEKVGYNDPYYFSKCFKKMYGVTPSAYLEKRWE